MLTHARVPVPWLHVQVPEEEENGKEGPPLTGEHVRLAERVYRWLLRYSRVRTTPSCGPHCSARILRAGGEYVIPGEYHCRGIQCHGKDDDGRVA